MRPRQAIASSLHLFVVLSFFLAGFFFVALPLLPEVRVHMADFLLNHFEVCTSVAFGFFVAAFFLLIGFYGLNRGKVLRLQMGQHLVSVEAALIEQSIEECFRKSFKKQIFLSDVEIVNGKKIEIRVTLAPLEEDVREQLFARAETALQTLLKERFGYTRSFDFIVRI